MRTQVEMEVPMAMAVAHMKMEDQVGMETHQGKDTPKEGGGLSEDGGSSGSGDPFNRGRTPPREDGN